MGKKVAVLAVALVMLVRRVTTVSMIVRIQRCADRRYF